MLAQITVIFTFLFSQPLATDGVPKDKTPYLLDDCILLTEKQIDELLEDMDYPVHDRKKRTALSTNFVKWNVMPIQWKFDGKHSKHKYIDVVPNTK